MLLDDLVGVIETLQRRIADHGASLRENETRTRMAPVDLLLAALGWDVADPAVAPPEYSASGGRADYALLKPDGSPIAMVEAKSWAIPRIAPIADASKVKVAGGANGLWSLSAFSSKLAIWLARDSSRLTALRIPAPPILRSRRTC